MEVNSSGDAAASSGPGSGADTGQALNDIQNYLEEFNKDIQVAPPAEQAPQAEAVQVGGFGDAGQNGGEAAIPVAVKEVSGLDQLAEASEQLSAEQAQAELAAAEKQQQETTEEEPQQQQQQEESATEEVSQEEEEEEATTEAPQLEVETEVTEAAEQEVAPELEAQEVTTQEEVHIVTADGQAVLGDLQNVQLVAVQGDGDGSQPQLVAMQPETTSTATTVVSASSVNSSGGNQVVLNTGGGSYQTVTIMPSETNQSGEVSYVLIVSQPDDEDKSQDNQDMSVYDFKEERGGAQGDVDEDGTPRKQPPQRKLPAGASPSLMCSYCNYTSPKRYLLTRHMKCHSEERPHKCAVCDRGFKTIASLNNHVNTHTGTRPHKCKECESAFTTSGELVRHVRYRHTFEKPHKCPECDYAAVELSKMKRHIRSHTGERPYQCPDCSYSSPDTYKLKRHRRIHTGEKPYVCNVCDARFTQSNSLKSHALIHSGNKPVFQCELCPTTCGRKADLRIHVQKLHTSDKPLQCKKCSKFFPDRYSYKIHLKTHDGEKCFKCDQCPYAALSERFLHSHLLTHTGEKPFECDICHQSFRQKQLLRRHKNLHHNPDYQPTPKKERIHECGECGKSFAHKGNLLRHMAIHDPTNPLYQVVPQDGSEEEEEEEEEEPEDDDDAPQHVEIIIQQVEPGEDGVQQLTVIHPVVGSDGQTIQAVVAEPTDEGEGEGEVEKSGVTVEDIFKDMQNQAEEEVLAGEASPKRATRGSKATPETATATSPRGRRGRPAAADDAAEEESANVKTEQASAAATTTPLFPAKRGRPKKRDTTPSTSPAVKKARTDKPADQDDKRDQARKDIEECFGFDDEES